MLYQRYILLLDSQYMHIFALTCIYEYHIWKTLKEAEFQSMMQRLQQCKNNRKMCELSWENKVDVRDQHRASHMSVM